MIICEIQATGTVSGEVTAHETLEGDVTAVGTLEGLIQVGHLSSADYLPYEGAYEVDPLTTEQKLSTKDKVLTGDIKVLGIGYHEVSNVSGGQTVTIGRE
ncbi:MAG: hypothetical protein II876_07440 [Synergistaceae bacterium]|nr:hypothetical protein [Synergistaceae bacterium]